MKQDSSGDAVVMIAEAARRVPHVAFFDALGTLTESDAEWRPVSAGVLVLRLVDSWLGGTSDRHTGLAQEIRTVREAVECRACGNARARNTGRYRQCHRAGANPGSATNRAASDGLRAVARVRSGMASCH